MPDSVAVQISIDREIKEQADLLFSSLALDMSGAVDMFLHRCALRGGIPFPVEMPRYNQNARDAMKGARRISDDPAVKSYDSLDDLKKAISD
ncbi:MAG: type II toxin-antitoxin system RelB/DinJ family antitoxin [Desulfovibrionaceae bacterium]|nr:type II toxin-antitoxin system RelB/DinJ family antitoxin [Desulfovibrionaceae bacterium]